MSSESRRSFAAAARKGVGASIRNNFTAYGFSVMITASLAVISAARGTPDTGGVFLFLLGAAGAFVIVEAAASGGFKHGVRGEPSEVLALGTAFNLISIASSVGAAALIAHLIGGELSWLVSTFAATLLYVLLSGLELAVAEVIKKG